MNSNFTDALKSLTETALGNADAGDGLAVYDAVAMLAAQLASSVRRPERGKLRKLATAAMSAATAIREADKSQLNFRDILTGGGSE
jgi:hypothetical protein